MYMYSKCTGCDQRNATVYHDEDMYCSDCYREKMIDDACYCDDDTGITCRHHMEIDNAYQTD